MAYEQASWAHTYVAPFIVLKLEVFIALKLEVLQSNRVQLY